MSLYIRVPPIGQEVARSRILDLEPLLQASLSCFTIISPPIYLEYATLGGRDSLLICTCIFSDVGWDLLSGSYGISQIWTGSNFREIMQEMESSFAIHFH